MALRQYAILDETGAPVATQVCEGESCFPTLQPGQTRVPLAADRAAPPPSTSIDPSGRRVAPVLPTSAPPVGLAEQAPIMGHPARLATPAPEAVPVAPPVAAPAPLPIQPVAPGAATAVSPPPTPLSPPMPSPPPSFGGGASGGAPTYADGSRHPAQGGAPRMPGGAFAQQDGGYDNRQQVSVPGGAAAGPFETRAARSPEGGMTGNYGSRGGGGGGGGSLAKDLYWRIRNTMEAKIGGMGPGGGSASSGYDQSAYRRQQRQYKRQGRRLDRAYDDWNELLANPEPQEARGWAKQHLGNNKGNYPDFLNNPISIAERGMGLDRNTTTGDWLAGLPVGDLAMITGGTTGHGMTRKVHPPKPPGILRKQGVEAPKPDFKRELDYSKFAKEAARLYSGLTSNSGNVLDMPTLMRQLATASKHGALRQGIDAQALYDPSGALDRAGGYFTSVIHATQPDFMARVYDRMLSRYLDEARAGMLNKRPKAIDRIVPEIARRFL